MITDIVNIKYINEFVSIAGKAPVCEGIDMFISSVGDYLGECLDYFQKRGFEEAGKELHKVKGAASSIGLTRVAALAKEIELDLLKERDNYPLDSKISELKEIIMMDTKDLRNFVMTLSGM
ncbi:MAG: Hpt domain-containing protein [Ruminobacter sp.]|jgi:two-component system aerobic respiration control sensor histidine kinase ArcB|nr:Hpt domain-containing protein [Ruminobacter sp.]